jgi:hypothetical protein
MEQTAPPGGLDGKKIYFAGAAWQREGRPSEGWLYKVA